MVIDFHDLLETIAEGEMDPLRKEILTSAVEHLQSVEDDLSELVRLLEFYGEGHKTKFENNGGVEAFERWKFNEGIGKLMRHKYPAIQFGDPMEETEYLRARETIQNEVENLNG